MDVLMSDFLICNKIVVGYYCRAKMIKIYFSNELATPPICDVSRGEKLCFEKHNNLLFPLSFIHFLLLF